MEHRNEKGKLHCTDGPTIEYADGYQAWWVNDKRHRTDGPAIKYANGYQEWWVDGKFIKGEQSGERKQKREMTNYKELREATTELLKAIDGLFPTDGPVKARVRAALKEKE